MACIQTTGLGLPTFTWDTDTQICTEMQDVFTSNLLPSDGTTVIGDVINNPTTVTTTADICCETGDTLSDNQLLMACQTNLDKTVTSYMAGDSNGMQTDQCFQNFDTVTTLSLSDGKLIRTINDSGSEVSSSADLCCNEGVAK